MKSWKVILAVGIGIGLIYLMYYLFFVKPTKKKAEDKEENARIKAVNSKYCIESRGMVGHKQCFEDRTNTTGGYWISRYTNCDTECVEVKDEYSPEQISKEVYLETTINNPNW